MDIFKFFKIFFAAILVSFSATSIAQCIPPNAPGPPRLWDGERGCYVPQGTPSLHQTGGGVGYFPSSGQVVWGGNSSQQGVQFIPVAQAMAGGLNRCEAVGAITGGTIGSFAKHHQAQAVVLGAILGGITGNAVCTNNQGQQVLVVQQPPQGGIGGPVVLSHNVCAHDQGTKQGVLNLPGHPLHGRTVCAKPWDTNISRWLE